MDRKTELRGTKLLRFKFQNGLEIVSGIGQTILERIDELDEPPAKIRVKDRNSLSMRDHYLKLTEAARDLDKYDREVDDILLDIAKYRWGR